MVSIAAGKLRDRVTLQKDVGTTRDSQGHRTADWQTQATVFAAIEQLGGDEQEVGNQIHAVATHRITVRYRADLAVDTTWRATFGGRVFHFASVANVDERNVLWVLDAVEEK